MGIIAFWIWDFGFRIEVAEGPVQNNGSLRSQKITFAGLSEAYEQTYTYDDLNRLKSAEEKIGTTTNWKQTFNYDRYGNRTFDAANTTTISVSNTVTNPSASTSTNRLAGHTYDAAGNLTVDAENRRFVYDAENHQTKLFLAANNSETPDAVYKYDGDGRRVKKISSTETTVFVYDGGGTLVAEYTALTGNDPAPTPQVSYLTQDHLGSPRVVTNQNGEVIKRTDWMAFGEEVEFNKRGTGVGYDEVPETRKGYTGYEKDDESGLDFAQARYYNPKHGRYTSVDPLTASANVRNPQTFNRYTYVLNSPYKFSDPLGLISSTTGACGGWCAGIVPGGEIPFDDVDGHKDPAFREIKGQEPTPPQTPPSTTELPNDVKKQVADPVERYSRFTTAIGTPNERTEVGNFTELFLTNEETAFLGAEGNKIFESAYREGVDFQAAKTQIEKNIEVVKSMQIARPGSPVLEERRWALESALSSMKLGLPVVEFSAGGSDFSADVATVGVGMGASWSVTELSEVKRYNESLAATDRAAIIGSGNFRQISNVEHSVRLVGTTEPRKMRLTDSTRANLYDNRMALARAAGYRRSGM